MITVNQNKANIQHQYIADTMNIGEINNAHDFKVELKKLQTALYEAIKQKALTGEAAVDAEYLVKKAVLQSEKEALNKAQLVET